MQEQPSNKRPGKKGLRIFLTVMLILLLLAAAAYITIFHINTFTLALLLSGEESMMLECDSAYTEPGAALRLSGSLFWKEGIALEEVPIEISGEVQEDTLGKYELSYSADYYGLHAGAVRVVHVIDSKPPMITLIEAPEEAYVPGSVFQEPGFTATDNHDGDITDRVVRTEATGEITYAVTDLSGNPTVVKRIVPDFDPQPPVITLTGGEDCVIMTGTVYQEPGYEAADNLDGDLTEAVVVEGEVDWLTPGTYPVTYTVADSGGNETIVQRTVTVEAAVWPDTEYPSGNTVYLTFDDGPGAYTRQLLDILDAYGAKATFFVVDSGYDQIMKEIVDRGHSIGIHSVTHKYEEIYASPEAFFADLYKMQDIIYENTGVRTTLMRFPGGSSNEISRRYCEGIMTTLTEAVQNAGFQYFDWNVLSGDAGDTKDTEEIIDYVVEGIRTHPVSIVLQHDIHSYSIAAVEDILIWGRKNGYTFRALQENSPGFHQYVFN